MDKQIDRKIDCKIDRLQNRQIAKYIDKKQKVTESST